MKIKNMDKTVSKKQGIANIGYGKLQDIRACINELQELKPYLDKNALWILELKISACNNMIKNMQDVIHTLSDIAPDVRQM